MAVNFPQNLSNLKDSPILSPPCSNWVYAAYLPPGKHNFLIYVPERVIKISEELQECPAPAGGKNEMVIPAKLYCKEILVNLRQKDLEPFIPKLLGN